MGNLAEDMLKSETLANKIVSDKLDIAVQQLQFAQNTCATNAVKIAELISGVKFDPSYEKVEYLAVTNTMKAKCIKDAMMAISCLKGLCIAKPDELREMVEGLAKDANMSLGDYTEKVQLFVAQDMLKDLQISDEAKKRSKGGK